MAENNPIIGRYTVEKSFSMVDGELGLFTREEAAADLEKRIAAGDAEEDDRRMYLQTYDFIYEFTKDGEILCWMKAPEDISEEDIKEAIESGEIKRYSDGFLLVEEKKWEEKEGKYFYDTGEYREILGEVKSSVDELVFDEEGLLVFGDGMMRLKKM